MFHQALRSSCCSIALLIFAISTAAAEVKIVKDLPYKLGDALSSYETERCKLDLYLPTGEKNFATLVWFHGGGLTAGSKDEAFTTKLATSWAEAGIAVVAVNYRLSPKATYPAYIDDAAASLHWTLEHIAEQGGDPSRIYLGGHSAGGYLAAIVGLSESVQKRHAIASDSIAGIIPVSGQMMTHYQIRIERGLTKFNVIADEAAPIYHARKSTPPMLVIYADRDMASRAEENAFFVSTIEAAGNTQVVGLVVNDRDHGSVAARMSESDDPGRKALLEFIEQSAKRP
ncbi:Alpha/beta hydrolase fold-3 domain protein [Pirellula staleyi DSM 6068]|uniref:Alpha/beta hydrolase fold-3 domain protein n=1 Tax=Pirellula staleyi (strain ATCC 27377 / DSM 6068 / ICPB 4128) TaxID=530564 RepID=D2QWC4_PIRSD|nr:alpha/beta fold hydrolase [Pirellula staleyi]ADB15999.1 Alpha/beta hydrolase fold-3 domain protein [Pirellula staleyi DSM 6068]